jgi:phosphate transport system substrate-binding protein
LFIYPSAEALERPEFDAFLEYYLENVNDIAEQVGFIGLTEEQLSKAKSDLEGLIGGAGGGTATTG